MTPTPRALIEGVRDAMRLGVCKSCDGTGGISVPAERKRYECEDCGGSGNSLAPHACVEYAAILTTALAGLVERPSPEQIRALEAAHAGLMFSAMPSRERDKYAAALRALLSSWEGKEVTDGPVS